MTDQYITIDSVMKILGCGRTKVFGLIRDGKLPAGSKIGKARQWREKDIRRVAEAMQPAEKELSQIIRNVA